MYTRKKLNQEKNGILWEFMDKEDICLKVITKYSMKIYQI